MNPIAEILRLDTKIDDYEKTLLTAIKDGRLVGTIQVDYKNLHAAFVTGLYVHQEWRGLGVGSVLLGACCAIARNGGCETIGLTIKHNNMSSRSFYKNLEFRVVYEYDNGQLLLSKILRGIK